VLCFKFTTLKHFLLSWYHTCVLLARKVSTVKNVAARRNICIVLVTCCQCFLPMFVWDCPPVKNKPIGLLCSRLLWPQFCFVLRQHLVAVVIMTKGGDVVFRATKSIFGGSWGAWMGQQNTGLWFRTVVFNSHVEVAVYVVSIMTIRQN